MTEDTLPEEPCTLPRGKSFVVQFHVDAEPANSRWSGRVEHVDSGESARFDTLEELLSFLCRSADAGSDSALVG